MRKADIILGVVILLLIIVVVSQYLVYHSSNNNSTPGLMRYLMGLGEPVTSDQMASTTSATTVSSQGQSGATTPVNSSAKPYMYALSPSSGSSGLTIIITGYNFSRSVMNYITFGGTDGRHSVNGLPDNVIAAVESKDGKTLEFNVPLSGPSGLLCDSNGKNCTSVSPSVLPAGSYSVTVSSVGGVSNTLYFDLTR